MKYDRNIYHQSKNAVGANDKDDLFPRCQHPDTRSNREAMQAIKEKLGLNTTQKQWYPKRVESHKNFMRPVICVTTGQRFAGIRKAAIVMDIDASNLCNHLKGKYPDVLGLVFKYE